MSGGTKVPGGVRTRQASAGTEGAHQLIQNLLSDVELLGSSAPHVWGIEQVGDGEIKGERHQGWARVCNWREKQREETCQC